MVTTSTEAPRRWLSPAPLPEVSHRLLVEAGLEQVSGEVQADEPLLLVYEPPHTQLFHLGEPSAAPDMSELCDRYGRILELSRHHPAISGWRLQALGSAGLRTWLQGSTPSPISAAPPLPDPLKALLVQQILRSHPDLLHHYLNLELVSELAGSEADSAYLQRLQLAVADPMAALDQLHQVQEESQAACKELSAKNTTLEADLVDAREEAELTLLQLHQVQEELEHYFLENREFVQTASRVTALTRDLWSRAQSAR